MRRTTSALLAVCAPALLVAAGGCNIAKSENPLSPTIAGPIAGVEISVPQVVVPAQAANIATDAQPLTLTLQNSSSNGVRPVSYTFEVASDFNFSTKVFTRAGVASGDGRTSVTLPDPLAPEHTYWWRAKADDGANASEYSGIAMFSIYTPVVIGAPGRMSPADGATLTTLRPTLDVDNATVTGPAGAISYLFEGSTDAGMANRVVSAVIAGGSTGHTSYTIPQDLAYATRYYWHVRAFDSSHEGPWSPTQSVVTPAAPVVTTPAPGAGTANPADQVDLSGATIVLGPTNIISWPVTSTVTSVTAVPGTLCINHTKLGIWPSTNYTYSNDGTLVEGNEWIFANIGGHWYGGASEWYRPGQGCKGVDFDTIGPDSFYQPSMEPLRSWRPSVGETFAVMSTTPARAWPDMATLDQRTNVVLVHWGG